MAKHLIVHSGCSSTAVRAADHTAFSASFVSDVERAGLGAGSVRASVRLSFRAILCMVVPVVRSVRACVRARFPSCRGSVGLTSRAAALVMTPMDTRLEHGPGKVQM